MKNDLEHNGQTIIDVFLFMLQVSILYQHLYLFLTQNMALIIAKQMVHLFRHLL